MPVWGDSEAQTWTLRPPGKHPSSLLGVVQMETSLERRAPRTSISVLPTPADTAPMERILEEAQAPILTKPRKSFQKLPLSSPVILLTQVYEPVSGPRGPKSITLRTQDRG